MLAPKVPVPQPAHSQSVPVARPGLNVLGLQSLAVASVGLILNLVPGVLVIGWLVSGIGTVLSTWALFDARGRSWKEAVAAMIVTTASAFAIIGMWRDVVAPFLE